MIDLARLLYIGVALLHYPEREVWKMSPYKLICMSKYHNEYNGTPQQCATGIPPAANLDPIDVAFGGF